METLTFKQVVQQPVVPASFLFSFLFLGESFLLFVNNIKKKLLVIHLVDEGLRQKRMEKQISWILTLISSLVCTIFSIPFVIQFFFSDLDVQLLGIDSQFHTGFICFFKTYLILDLALGCLFYRNRITLITGWVHHIFYILTLFCFLRLQISPLFTVSSILELPTLILAAGSMVHEWRSDFLFGSTFFVLRLVAHGWMMVPLKRYHRIQLIWIIPLTMHANITRYSSYPHQKALQNKRNQNVFNNSKILSTMRDMPCNTSIYHLVHSLSTPFAIYILQLLLLLLLIYYY